MKKNKIDVHYSTKSLATALKKLKEDLTEDNYKQINNFLTDLDIGLTGTKRPNERTQLKIMFRLKTCALYFDKKNIRIDKIDLANMKRFISDLQNDVIQKQRPNSSNLNYSDNTKSGIKKELRRYLKYRMGETAKWKKLTAWFDTTTDEQEIIYIKRDEVKRLLLNTGTFMNKTIIQVLYDSGMRAEAFLNLFPSDISQDEETGLFVIDVRPETTKTKKGRKIFLYMAETTEILGEYLRGIKDKDQNSQLFPLTYDGLRLMISRLTKKTLGKSYTPHSFRRGSASFYASSLNHYQLCQRFSWSASSDIPNKYVDLSCVNQKKIAKKITLDQVGEFKERMNKLESENNLMKENQKQFELKTAELLSKIMGQIQQSEQEPVLEIVEQYRS
ncbi:tyrosine-type recombinase/integrase [Candidatus Woesearchaeota archaeon]|jgi:site-specific recombinase XerD|nr:tyrosine-type recombinase/integrase [Candidatus Woesearchaeota archaeon]MBT7238031.1 tyrosine-type recombinase/integrase [Candidatus Woesearchaeota archaeon]